MFQCLSLICLRTDWKLLLTIMVALDWAWCDWVSEISAKVFSLCLLSDVPNYLKGDKYHIHTFHRVSHYMNAVSHRFFFLANFKAGCELSSHTFLFPSKFPQCLFLSAK